MKMPRFMPVLISFVGMAAWVSCTPPCDELAEKTCLEQGAGSPVCVEIRKRASEATDEERRYCREALSILRASN